MAEKEFNIKVTTTSDTTGIDDITEALEQIKADAEAAGADLSGSLDEAGASADNTASSLDDAGSSANDLGNSVDGIDGANLENIANSAEQAADSLSRAGESADQMSTGMGVMEGSMLLSASEQVSQMGASAEDMSVGLDNAQISLGQLATKTGMTESAVTSMINNISNETFPQDEALAYVNVLNQMGVSSDKLGDSATNMDRINDATHMGAGKVMLLTQGLQSMGITADNLPAAFNAIAYAESNVGGGAETVQQVLKRQAGTLNEYGMNVDATVVALSSLQKETGLTGMKLGSEFGKRLEDCNGDLGALESSLGLTAGTLSNASQETDKYNGKLMELANQELEHKTITERIGAAWEDVSTALAPVLSPLGSVIGLMGQVGSFALGINGIITLAETFGLLKTATLATIPTQIAEGIAGMISIGWVLLAVAVILVLIGVMWYLYNNNEQVRQALDWLGQTFMALGQWIWNGVVYYLQILIGYLQILWGYVNTVIQGLMNAVNAGNGNILASIANVIIYLATLPAKIATIFINLIANALGFKGNFVQTLTSAAMNAVNGFANAINGIKTALSNCLNWAKEIIMSHPLVKTLKWLGEQASDAFSKLGLGQRSPGKIAKSMQKELDWASEAVNDSSLAKDTMQLGANLGDSFNVGSLKVPDNEVVLGTNNSSKQEPNEYNITVNVGTVDNEDRIKEIVEAVRKSLAWSNTTAGRTV